MISRRNLLQTSALALTMVGAFGLAPAQAQGAYSMSEMLKPGPLPEIILGKPDAPITIIEYASMTCGHCAHFHETVFPHLKEKYIDTGKVRFIYREFPLDTVAAAVSMLIRCSPQDKYFDMLHLFYSKQDDWIDRQKPVDTLLGFSKQVGFTQATFNACVSDQKMLDGLKDVQDRAAKQFQVSGTPAFFINGREADKKTNMSTPEAVDKELARYL